MGQEAEYKLKKEDIEKAVSILPDKVKTLLITRSDNLVLAGGFLRSVVNNEPIRDIDLFSKDKEAALLNFHLFLSLHTIDIFQTISTGNSYTVKTMGVDVQFIHRWCYPTAKSLINSFDFSIARAALWYDPTKNYWDSVVDPFFYEDCLNKRIRFLHPVREEEPAGSMMRVLKFNKIGYEITSFDLSSVIMKLVDGSEKRDNNKPTVNSVAYSLARCGGGS